MTDNQCPALPNIRDSKDGSKPYSMSYKTNGNSRRGLVLYELSADELTHEWQRPRAWEIKGSTEHCHHANIPTRVARNRASLEEFYAEYPPRGFDVTNHPVIGWFWSAEG